MINKNKLSPFLHVNCSNDIHNSFSTTINNARANFYGFNKDLVSHKISYNSALKNESGQFDVELDGYYLQCFYYNNVYAEDHLVIGLNGARPFEQQQEDPTNEKPKFKRWSYYPLYNGCYLNIDDPMFKKFPRLLLGWYYGSKETSALSPVIKLVKTFMDEMKIPSKNVKFFSSSGGGYACILSSIMLPGSISISINPQIYIQKFSYSKAFKKITGIDLNQEDALLRNNLSENIKNNSKSKHFIIVNTECYHDMKDHLVPFSKEMGMELRYGLSIKNNVLIWCYQACGASAKIDPHVSYETKHIYAVIDYIADRFQNSLLTEDNVEQYQSLVLLTNEFWFEHYKMRYIYSELENIKRGNKIVYLNYTDKKVASDLLCSYTNISVKANSLNYNCWKLPITFENSLFSIIISGLNIDSECQTLTIALCDPERKKRIVKREINLIKENKTVFNFITNELEKELTFQIYCGMPGKTKGINMSIESIEVYCNQNEAHQFTY